MTQRKRYTVHVEKVFTEWRVIEVQAESQWEAEELAIDSFDPASCNGGCDQREATVLTEDGEPVEWSHEAWKKDRRNPYRKKREAAKVTDQPQNELPAQLTDRERKDNQTAK